MGVFVNSWVIWVGEKRWKVWGGGSLIFFIFIIVSFFESSNGGGGGWILGWVKNKNR